MSEVAMAAQSPVEAIIAANERPIFPLDLPFFEIAFTVPWAGPDGKITVTHKLRRPTPSEESEYKKKIFYQERIGSGGSTSDERSEVNAAQIWLWDRIAASLSGYPGLADESPATPDIAAKMRSAHKELAISSLFECTAEVIHEESVATFDGGEWVVRLKLGNVNAPYAVLKLKIREWEEKERRQYERGNAISSSEQQGKTRLVRASVNQAAYTKLFDELLLNVDGDLAIPTVNGKTFAESSKAAFAGAFLGEWKVEVVTVLSTLWRKKLSDSQKS